MSRQFRRVGAQDVRHDTDARYRDGELTFTDVEGEAVTLDAVAVGDDEWLLRWPDGSSRRALVARRRGTWWIHFGGHTWALERVHPAAAARAAGSLTAPMHGTVESVYVQVGDEVEADQPLLSISAMKMQIEIKAPHAGTVTELPRGEDEQVEGGTLLAVVEPQMT